MLNDHNGIPAIGQTVKHLQEFFDVIEMQAGSRFVKDVERSSGRSLTQFTGQLDALRLTAGESRRRLTKMEIAETYILQHLQFLPDGRNVSHHFQCLDHGEIENVGDISPLIQYLQGLPVIALTAANFTGYKNIGKEMHLDPDEPIALTGLTSSPFDIEREPPRLVASHLGLGKLSKKLPDVTEQACVGCRVGARGATNRGLIDTHHPLEMLPAYKLVKQPGLFSGSMEALGHGFPEGIHHKTALTGT